MLVRQRLLFCADEFFPSLRFFFFSRSSSDSFLSLADTYEYMTKGYLSSWSTAKLHITTMGVTETGHVHVAFPLPTAYNAGANAATRRQIASIALLLNDMSAIFVYAGIGASKLPSSSDFLVH